MSVPTVGSPLLWIGFTIFVLLMLAVDLGLFHRKAHEVSSKEALSWTVVWVSLALFFNWGVYTWMGHEKGLEFLTGYLIEEALSVDNIFVFIIIFRYFSVPKLYEHRVLFWGILGAMIMRAIFILIGATLMQKFHWIIFVFGGFLLLTGFKILFQKSGSEEHPEKKLVVRLFKKLVPMVSDYHGSHFLIRDGKRFKATPLLLVLVVVEATDVVFATDSIPAIFAVTTDPFIVYTSNIFAILGLRSLYFLLASVIDKFHYLKIGLGMVLIFVGFKMLISDFYKIPIAVSLAMIGGMLGISILTSILVSRSKK